MSALFSSPKVPAMPKAPDPVPVPTVDEAAMNAESADKIRRRKGAAASVLTTSADLAPAQVSAGAKLLGQ